MGYRPIPLRYPLISSTLIGAVNTVIGFIAFLAIDTVFLHGSRHLTLGAGAAFAAAAGLGGTWLSVVLTRLEQYRQQRSVPWGTRIFLIQLASPAVVGAIAGMLYSRPFIGAAVGILGVLPDFLVGKPWEEHESEEEFQRKNEKFRDMTRRTIAETKQEMWQNGRSGSATTIPGSRVRAG